jgi:hypothetical protein
MAVNYTNKIIYSIDPAAVFTTLIFFITYEWDQYARVLHYTKLEGLLGTNSGLSGPLVSFEENVV